MGKDNMRKEMKMGFGFLIVLNILNYPVRSILGDVPILEFLHGGLLGLSLLGIAMGMLPEAVYLKIKRIKKRGK